MTDEVLATLEASQPRRIFACGVFGVLGVMLIWLGFLTTPQFFWSVALVGAGVAVIWMAWSQFRSSTTVLELTAGELRTDSGDLLTPVADIAAVERGVMAFKPSQGFLLRTRTSGPRAWCPGIYWRLGRSLGVGGVTNAAQGKFMAETIEALLAERDRAI